MFSVDNGFKELRNIVGKVSEGREKGNGVTSHHNPPLLSLTCHPPLYSSSQLSLVLILQKWSLPPSVQEVRAGVTVVNTGRVRGGVVRAGCMVHAVGACVRCEFQWVVCVCKGWFRERYMGYRSK